MASSRLSLKPIKRRDLCIIQFLYWWYFFPYHWTSFHRGQLLTSRHSLTQILYRHLYLPAKRIIHGKISTKLIFRILWTGKGLRDVKLSSFNVRMRVMGRTLPIVSRAVASLTNYVRCLQSCCWSVDKQGKPMTGVSLHIKVIQQFCSTILLCCAYLRRTLGPLPWNRWIW